MELTGGAFAVEVHGRVTVVWQYRADPDAADEPFA
jgi:hypothetical protein